MDGSGQGDRLDSNTSMARESAGLRWSTIRQVWAVPQTALRTALNTVGS